MWIAQITIFIKHKTLVPMSLYHTRTVPHSDQYLGVGHEYMFLHVPCDYLAMMQSPYIPLTQQQLTSRNCTGATYYWENMQLIRQCSKHICSAVIYYGLLKQLLNNIIS